MSFLPLIADICSAQAHVRFVPIADISPFSEPMNRHKDCWSVPIITAALRDHYATEGSFKSACMILLPQIGGIIQSVGLAGRKSLGARLVWAVLGPTITRASPGR